MDLRRREEQFKALRSWVDNNFKGTALCCTGFGKTFVGIFASCRSIFLDKSEKWLILVPTVNLISQWREEAYKWGFGELYDSNVTCICYQSWYKLDNPDEFTGIIADEIHVGLSKEYRKVFEKLNYKKLLCLTATEPENEEYNIFLQSIAPTIYSITLEEAVNLGIVAPFKIDCVPVELTEVESLLYKKANKSFVYYKMLLGEFNAFEKATEILSKKSSDYKNRQEFLSERKKALMFYKAIRDRGEIVKNASNKLEVVKVLLDNLDFNKCITFSETIEATDKLHTLLSPKALKYHSKQSKKDNIEALKSFKLDKSKKILCSTKALNAGLDVPSASLAIIYSLTSKSLPLIQRIGRVIRFEKGKLGKIIILYIKDSQEEVWLKNSFKKLDKKNINFLNSYKECLQF